MKILYPTSKIISRITPIPFAVTGFLFCLQLFGIVAIPAAQEQINPDQLKKSYQKNLPKDQQRAIIEKSAKIRKLQEGIIDHKIKILGSKKKERSLLSELEQIEHDLREQKKKLASLQENTEKQELLLVDRQKYLSGVIKEKRAHQIHVKNRLAAYYRMGSVGLMNVVFSAESLPELMDFQEYFNLMLEYDQSIITKYLVQIEELNRAREALAREKLRLMTLTKEVTEKENQLSRLHKEKNLLLKRVNTEKHLYEQAVTEIEEAAADLAATLSRIQSATEKASRQPKKPIASIQKKAPSAKKRPQPEGFVGQKGLLPTPVNGIVITQYGQNIQGKFGSTTTSSGIDIKTKNGLEIKAVYDGKIIHAGYLRGYGNLVIIDHGQQYFSMIARIADIYKKEGTRIKQGEILGMTGEVDVLYGDGLHFEIRKGSTPEDPSLWLLKDSLPVISASPTQQ
jgi:septal ring factor EnvC (AmiA/AmiB activator)